MPRWGRGDAALHWLMLWVSRSSLRVTLAVLLGAFTPSLNAQPPPVPPPSATPTPTPAPTPVTVPLPEIAAQSGTAVTTLNGIEAEGRAESGLNAVRAALPELSDRISLLAAEGNRTTAAGSASLDALRELQAAWRRLRENLDDRAEALTARAKALDAQAAEVKNIRTLWLETDKAAKAKESGAPPETLALIRTVLDAAEAAGRRVKTSQTALLELQSRLSDLGGRVGAALGSVEQAQNSAVRTLLERDSPPLWSPGAWPDDETMARNRRSLGEQREALGVYVRQRGHLFAIHGVIFAVLLGVFLWLRRGLRRWTESEPHLQHAAPIFEVPLAAALALSFLVKGPIYEDAPSLLRAILGALVLLPTIVILRRLLDRRLFPVLNSLVVFYLLDQLRVATAALPRINRWVFTLQMAGAFAVFVWLAVAERAVFATAPTLAGAKPGKRTFAARWVPAFTRLASGLILAALVAEVLGFVRLGTYLGTSTLRSGYVAVFLYALLSVLQGLVLIALRLRPFTVSRIARVHREGVQRHANRLLAALAIGFWGWWTLDFFGVRTAIFEAVGNFLERPLPIGSLSFAPGHVLGFGVAIWLSVMVSRLLRFFLDEEVYERVHLSAGLPYAISTILNYGVLLVGFIIALGLLGVDLTKVTIVASAFSVGLGFGLQNIINNFVSGVILLFERPVKVGDVIQIGADSGEVRRIGIRASIIRTPEGSDLIVPNGNLISNPVTNWTYSDRARAVEVTLTLAAAPDPNRVLELLRRTAAEQSTGRDGGNAPQAFITGINAGNLSVVVRAWAEHYEDWTRLRSNLSAALVEALGREGVKIV